MKSLFEAINKVTTGQPLKEAYEEDEMSREEIDSLLDDTAAECEEMGGECKALWDNVASAVADGDLAGASAAANQLMDMMRGDMDEACKKTMTEEWVALDTVDAADVVRVRTVRSGEKSLEVVEFDDENFYCVFPGKAGKQSPLKVPMSSVTSVSTSDLDEAKKVEEPAEDAPEEVSPIEQAKSLISQAVDILNSLK